MQLYRRDKKKQTRCVQFCWGTMLTCLHPVVSDVYPVTERKQTEMKTIKTECSNVIRAENISTSQSEGRRGALRSKAGLLSSYWLVGGDGGGGGGAFSHFLLVIQSVRSSQSSKYIWSSRLCVFRQSTIVPSRGKGFWIRFVFNFPKTHIKFVFLIHLFIYLF